jgi:hypothetical protein
MAVTKEDASLASAAWNVFGGWDEAVRAAGIDPDEVRLQRAGWTKALVVGEILSRRRKGGRLNRSAVQREQTALASAARAMFGGWDAALRAAGIDPATVRMRRKWTAEGMISAIRARQRAGKALTYAAAERDDAGLVGAAKPLFGSWDGALRAAGIRPKFVRGRPRS